MTFALVGIAMFGLGLELGRLWLAHERRPHWDELTYAHRELQRELDKAYQDNARLKEQRNSLAETCRRLRDRGAV